MTKGISGENTGIARCLIRVSHQGERGKGEGKGEFLSPEIQLEAARDYLRCHMKGYVLDEEASLRHMDIDKSASRLSWHKRPGLVAHLEAARRGEFDAIVIFKLSRLARNAKEGLQLFEEFGKAGCRVHCIKENIDTETPTGKLVTTILLAMAEMESENIADWVSAAALTAVKKGKLHAQPVYWLTRDSEGYVLNEHAETMRRLVDFRLQGYSCAKVARMLNEEGFRSPHGLYWTAERIRVYLAPDKLKLLCGHYVYGLGKKEDDPGRVVLQNAVPAVISQEEADAVLAFNSSAARLYSHGNVRRAAATSYLLSGLVWCGHCGGKMVSRSSKAAGRAPKPYYHCKHASSLNLPHVLGAAISGEGLEDAVLRVVQAALLDYQEVAKKEGHTRPKPVSTDNNLERRIEKLDEKISRLLQLYTDGRVKQEDFDPQYNQLDGERERMRERLNQTDSESMARLVVEQTAAEVLSGAVLTKEQARRLVLAFVERIDAPFPADHLPKARCHKRQPKAAWVKLRLPMSDGTCRILAPIYDPRYSGERVLLKRE